MGTMKALNAGKHVLCEKPLVESLEDVERLYNTAAEKGLLLLCGMSRRYDAAVQKTHKAIKSGQVGSILNISGVSRDGSFPPLGYLKTARTIYYDAGVHDVDLHLWFSGEKPHTVFVMGDCFNDELKPYNVDDSGAIFMKFPSGAFSTIELSRYSQAGFYNQFIVHGTKKTVGSSSLPEDSFVEWGSSGMSQSSRDYDWSDRFKRSFVEEWKHFYDCLTGKVNPLVTKEEVMSVTLTLDAIDLSKQTGLPIVIDHEKRTFQTKQQNSSCI